MKYSINSNALVENEVTQTSSTGKSGREEDTDLSKPLTEGEKEEWKVYRSTIRNDVKAFVRVGHALWEIKERDLYRDDYPTFEEFCKAEVFQSKSHANRLIQASRAFEVIDKMAPIGAKKLPTPQSESQVRPLTRLDDPEDQKRAWARAVEMSGEKPVTAKIVQNAVNEIQPPKTKSPRPKSEEPEDEEASEVKEVDSELIDALGEWRINLREAFDNKNWEAVDLVESDISELQQDAEGNESDVIDVGGEVISPESRSEEEGI